MLPPPAGLGEELFATRLQDRTSHADQVASRERNIDHFDPYCSMSQLGMHSKRKRSRLSSLRNQESGWIHISLTRLVELFAPTSKPGSGLFVYGIWAILKRFLFEN